MNYSQSGGREVCYSDVHVQVSSKHTVKSKEVGSGTGKMREQKKTEEMNKGGGVRQDKGRELEVGGKEDGKDNPVCLQFSE